jgi:tRNA(adenine34) deaminase
LPTTHLPVIIAGVDEHIIWMREALAEAAKAALIGDIPVGAVAVRGDTIVGRGYNRKECDRDPTAHAEMMAMRQAAQALGGWRLVGVTLYCTLEPCAMCAGAMIQARLPHLVWAASDPKAGAGGSVLDLLCHEKLNHRVQVTQGILMDEAQAQLAAFFNNLRSRSD